MGVLIPTEQGFNMRYFYGEEELRELLVLVKNGGKAVIWGDYLQVSDGYLRHFKSGSFEGPWYSMLLEGVVEIIEDALGGFRSEPVK
ncbi:hypothetical protein ACSEE7_14280 [Halomonas cupida]|uniref:hypothetical protein n=1 Tax=Halomonas cupida TaxID=44933 RepID=UPI003EF0E11E